MELTQDLAAAATELDLSPQAKRWRSLTSCVLDAVWSIGISYDTMVAPAVRGVFQVMDGGDPLADRTDTFGPDPIPLSAFRQRFRTAEQLVAETSKHRTSSKSGILKADAALRYADVLLEHQVDTLADAQDVMGDLARAEEVTTELKKIPGDGVRTGYFWMLVGNRDLVKPDRHILAWLRRHGHATDVAGAREALADLAGHLTRQTGQQVTPSDLDHAIWRSEARR